MWLLSAFLTECKIVLHLDDVANTNLVVEVMRIFRPAVRNDGVHRSAVLASTRGAIL
jgi:hypothetical protein